MPQGGGGTACEVAVATKEVCCQKLYLVICAVWGEAVVEQRVGAAAEYVQIATAAILPREVAEPFGHGDGDYGVAVPDDEECRRQGVRYVLHGREVAGALLAAERITAVGGIHNGVIQQQQVGPLRHIGQRGQRGGQMSACGAARGSYAGGVYAQSVGVAAHPCHGVACILDALCGR